MIILRCYKLLLSYRKRSRAPCLLSHLSLPVSCWVLFFLQKQCCCLFLFYIFDCYCLSFKLFLYVFFSFSVGFYVSLLTKRYKRNKINFNLKKQAVQSFIAIAVDYLLILTLWFGFSAGCDVVVPTSRCVVWC